jgi:hypothetical protein
MRKDITEQEPAKGEVVAPVADWPDAPESLEAAEAVIERGLGTFLGVGQALARIRDERWYRELGFEIFDDYCRDRWGVTRRYADYQIDAAHVGTIVLARGLPAPGNESVARQLAPLLKDEGEDELAAKWGEIVQAHKGDGRITAREVSAHLDGKPDKPESGGTKKTTHDRLLDVTRAFNTFSDALERKLEKKLDGRLLPKRSWPTALDYADHCDKAAERLRKLAGEGEGEDV